MEDTTIKDVLKTFQTHYQNQEFEEALMVLQKGELELPPGLWHYNLGTVYAKLDRLPLARLHFLTARSKGFRDGALLHNLTLVEDGLNVQRFERAEGFRDYLAKAGEVLSGDLLIGMSLALLVLSLVILRKFRGQQRSWILLFLFALPLLLNWWFVTRPRAMTLTTVEVFEGPSEIFRTGAEVPPGIRLYYETNGDWAHVYAPARFKGWIKLRNLQPLE